MTPPDHIDEHPVPDPDCEACAELVEDEIDELAEALLLSLVSVEDVGEGFDLGGMMGQRAYAVVRQYKGGFQLESVEVKKVTEKRVVVESGKASGYRTHLERDEVDMSPAEALTRFMAKQAGAAAAYQAQADDARAGYAWAAEQLAASKETP